MSVVALTGFAAAVLSYLVGSIPFGFIAGKVLAGVDIRRHGSGNIGAANVARYFGGVKGVLAFLAVFLLDLGKGVAAAWGLAAAGRALMAADDPANLLGIACGLLAIVGHVFPVWLGFKGGKAVATSCGVMLALAPLEIAGAVAVWVVVAAVTRIISLASVLAALGLVVARFFVVAEPWQRTSLPLTVMIVLVAALVVLRHRTNIRRLVVGTEPRFGKRRPPAGAAAASARTRGPGPTDTGRTAP